MFYPRSLAQLVTITPGDPTAINSATNLMNGLGATWTLTPQASGRVLLCVSGNLVENAATQTASLQLSYGTGAAPANAAAVTGTQVGGVLSWVTLAAQLTLPFSMSAIVAGLTPRTAYWFDLATKSSAGTIQVTNLHAWAIEV